MVICLSVRDFEATPHLRQKLYHLSDNNCPIDGKVVAVNEELLQSPELINKSPFESGWIVKLEPSNISQLENLMAEEEYKKFVGED